MRNKIVIDYDGDFSIYAYKYFLNYCCNCNNLDLLYSHNVKRGGKLKKILRPIGVISRALDSIANIEFKEVDLTRGQYLYLARICEEPGIILERMANLLKVDKTTAARAIQKLEKKGLIKRQTQSDNLKIKKIFPTDKGESLYPLLKREENYSNSVALKGFSDEEQAQLFEYLDRVSLNVDDDWNLVKSGYKRDY